MNYKTPGVYVEEIPKLPPSIAQVETAIPCFIGYTEKVANTNGQPVPPPASGVHEPKRITSMLEYERFFGLPDTETALKVTINTDLDADGNITSPVSALATIGARSKYLMYYSLQLFFANGGGPCWIVSVGDYSTGLVNAADLLDGLAETEKIDEITLYLYPDAMGLGLTAVDVASDGNVTPDPLFPTDFYNLYSTTLSLCAKLKDRFTIMDIWQSDEPAEYVGTSETVLSRLDAVPFMRDLLSGTEEELKYGAAYFPNVNTILDYYYGGEGNATGEAEVDIEYFGEDLGDILDGVTTLAALKTVNDALYFHAQAALRNLPLEMPVSPGIAGVYARVDSSRGVWKAPANVGLNYVIAPTYKVDDDEQGLLNVDTVGGKSVNVVRSFKGRGNAIVWGARTLAGNSNEWRYVSVRRFFSMVEESVKNATMQFVFEPNDRNTWIRVKSMIDNFLILQWKAGALQGTTPKEAFYVKIGLNETMSEVDIWEGRMIVEVGMAVVRPAEFIILRFSHKLLAE